MKKSQKNNKKKPFRNKCLVADDKKYESTNREIITHEKNLENLNLSQEEEMSDEEDDYKSGNKSEEGSSDDEQNVMKKEDFDLKLFMLVMFSF
jgi:hypothetical protein